MVIYRIVSTKVNKSCEVFEAAQQQANFTYFYECHDLRDGTQIECHQKWPIGVILRYRKSHLISNNRPCKKPSRTPQIIHISNLQ